MNQPRRHFAAIFLANPLLRHPEPTTAGLLARGETQDPEPGANLAEPCGFPAYTPQRAIQLPASWRADSRVFPYGVKWLYLSFLTSSSDSRSRMAGQGDGHNLQSFSLWLNSLLPPQQLPNRLNEQQRWLTGLSGVTARSTVFASTIKLVFQPGAIPAIPACSPQGHTRIPQNHPSLSGDAPGHFGWAEHIPPAQCPRKAPHPFLQTCCPTPSEGSRFVSTHRGLIALIARVFLARAKGWPPTPCLLQRCWEWVMLPKGQGWGWEPCAIQHPGNTVPGYPDG